MSGLLKILVLILLVGLGFYAERTLRPESEGWFTFKPKAPVPAIPSGEANRAVTDFSRKQMEMVPAAAKARDAGQAPRALSGTLAKTLQLVMVTAPDWEGSTCEMQRYRRPTPGLAWEKVGPPAPCVLGKAGLGVAAKPGESALNGPEKKDGDGKTPAGLFAASQAFGFKSAEEAKNLGVKLPYMEVGENLICVSDPKSANCGKLISSGGKGGPRGVNLAKLGEAAKWGLTLGAAEGGSCAACQTLMVWGGPGKATGGSLGCHEARLLELLAWLDPGVNPYLAIVPAQAMEQARVAWGLP